jgi:hypothetical protein
LGSPCEKIMVIIFMIVNKMDVSLFSFKED